MDADQYSEAIQYEQLTQAVYQAILQKEGVVNVQVEHDVRVVGRSGVSHQIDVLWQFKQAGIEHAVMIECKNYARSLTIEKVRNFYAVIQDIGNAQGLMVTKTGYQSGAADLAKFYGIGLKLLRKPTDDDWAGRIRDIHLDITAKSVVVTEEKPLTAKISLRPSDDAQVKRLELLQHRQRLNIPSGPGFCFLDANGQVATEEMKWWLPRQLDTRNKDVGGPYTQKIELKDKFVLLNAGHPDQELVRVIDIEVSYFVESFSHEVISHGEQLVDAILKDFDTNEVEYVKKA